MNIVFLVKVKGAELDVFLSLAQAHVAQVNLEKQGFASADIEIVEAKITPYKGLENE